MRFTIPRFMRTVFIILFGRNVKGAKYSIGDTVWYYIGKHLCVGTIEAVNTSKDGTYYQYMVSSSPYILSERELQIPNN